VGLRPGPVELFSLKWDDVDFEGENILIRSAKKGGIESRLVPLHHNFKKTLEGWKAQDEGKTDFIIHYKGKPVKTLNRSFNTAKRKAGITRRLRLYDFRHSFATALLSEKEDPKLVADLIGHSRVETTLTIYDHVTTSRHRAAINRLPPIGNHKLYDQDKSTTKP